MSDVAKKRPGRPPLKRGQESVNVTFRVVQKDYRRIRREAKRAGLLLSDWLREKTGCA